MKRLAVLLLFLALASTALAQNASGRISGRVLDQTGAVLPGVTIELAVDGVTRTTTTDDEGRFQFENVPARKAALMYRLLNFSIVRTPTSIF